MSDLEHLLNHRLKLLGLYTEMSMENKHLGTSDLLRKVDALDALIAKYLEGKPLPQPPQQQGSEICL
jgi:hypothetical protein